MNLPNSTGQNLGQVKKRMSKTLSLPTFLEDLTTHSSCGYGLSFGIYKSTKGNLNRETQATA